MYLPEGELRRKTRQVPSRSRRVRRGKRGRQGWRSGSRAAGDVAPVGRRPLTRGFSAQGPVHTSAGRRRRRTVQRAVLQQAALSPRPSRARIHCARPAFNPSSFRRRRVRSVSRFTTTSLAVASRAKNKPPACTVSCSGLARGPRL